MKCQHLILGFFCVLISSTFILAQDTSHQTIREDKIDQILRLQDSRLIYDGKLISFFSDEDPFVRERAVRAFGSIQDTAFIDQLLDRFTYDPDPSVQSAAAFAIGQSAGQLTEKAKEKLQHELIWVRLDHPAADGDSGVDTNPSGQLIEEIGKFGTATALRDLLLRFGNVEPPQHSDALVRSVGRFAIRGVTSAAAVQYLLKRAKQPDTTQWEVVYALQRIGNHEELRANVEQLLPLYRHDDPLVRMNVAALFGKVRDEDLFLDPLTKLAEFDPDWRVRVNALRALGNYGLRGRDEIIRTFRRSFFHKNLHIALTALSAFGNTNVAKSADAVVSEAFAALEKIALNKDNEYLWQLQAEAATALARLVGKDAQPFVHPTEYPQPHLRARLLVAMGMTGAPSALETLLDFADDKSPILHRAALEGLLELSKRNLTDTSIIDRTYDVSIDALKTRDVAAVATAASILGDSLFLRTASIAPLVASLEQLSVPNDVEAVQEITSTLGKLKDRQAVEVLRRGLEMRDRSVALASVSALRAITGRDYHTDIPKYIEPIFTDYDFAYLHSLPAVVKMKLETIHGDIVIELYRDVAPFTVMSFVKLATERGFFRGLTFHRVVPNFVVQGGDPRGDGWGGPGYSIRSEFSPLTYDTGTIGIASAGKDTEGSQFFITHSPQPHLDGRYTIVGRVVAGMDIVDRLQIDDHIYDVKIIR